MATLVILLLVLLFVVFPTWVVVRLLSLGKENESLVSQLYILQRDVQELRQRLELALRTPPAEKTPVPAVPPITPPTPAAPAPLTARPEPVIAAPTAPVPPKPIPTPISPAPPPPLPTAPPSYAAPRPSAPAPVIPAAKPATSVRRPTIDWEQFMGAKLFAWLGGLAALLGVAFFVKYSFEHNWISPEVRVAIGYLFAIGLVIGGLKIDRARYAITAQTLIATGIVSLYAVTFACNSIYKFEAFARNPLLSFALMALITVAAFLLAVRLAAKVVAVLGMLGGFLTPVLLSTGRDNPVGLFGYLAILNAGLIAVALHRRWHFLVALGAAGTVMMQLGWAEKFLEAAKAPTAMVVCLSFCVLFLAAYYVARWTATSGRRRIVPTPENAPGGRVPPPFLGSAIAFPFVAFLFAFAFLNYPTVAARPGLLFAFVFLADLCLLAIAWLDEQAPKLHLLAGATVFAFLCAWTGLRLTDALLPWALAGYLVYAALHTAFPVVLERRRPAAAPTWWSQLFPPLALLLMLGPLFKLDAISLLFWPCVLLIDALAIALALFTGSIVAVAAVLILTLVATALWIFQVPMMAVAETGVLLVIGGFALLFFAAGMFLARRFGPGRGVLIPEFRAPIPALSALLPFLLLILMTQRLPLANPSPVFGLALLLTGLTLGLAAMLNKGIDAPVASGADPARTISAADRGFAFEWLPACALTGVGALEYAWRARHFETAPPLPTLAWFVVFHAAFAVYPFLFRRRFATLTGPWAIAALSGVVQFPLVYSLVERSWPNEIMGLVPALFVLPPLLSLILILRTPAANQPARLNQLAWFGGVALLFITLIFPIQFERQWITVGWALEGTALLWLFHRVPHPGLRATGAVLLVAAFARLALNPAVFGYHPRSATPIFNWYLYTYGLVIACLFAAARLTAPPRDRVLGLNAPVVFNTLGTVLAFLLLNVEIADYFRAPGTATLAFEFSGNFARDMTYTIAWALFALGLLFASIWKQTRAGRYASLALLGVVLLKLFFHDLARLEALYRIGALFAVAVIAIVASFAYQRFLPMHEKNADEES